MKPPPRTWFGKFADSFRGLFRAVATQSSCAAHLTAAVAAVAVAAWLRISAVEWCLVTLTIGLVIMAEVFNTSIESLARAFDRYPDDRIGDALDHASGGVLVTVLTAIVVGLIILGPRLWALLPA